jgi:hypothetical protein
METMAATGANNGARCPKGCTATTGEASGQGRLDHRDGNARQQLSRPLSCSPRRDRIAEVIDMPLGRVGHRLGSGRCDESFFRPVGNHDRACGFLTAIERSRNPEGGTHEIGIADLTELALNLQKKKEKPP